MLSSTYQMSTVMNVRAAQVDPENRLWWRMNRRRLEAEALRDGLLAACGTLDLTMGGSMLPTKNHDYVTGTGSNLPPNLYNSQRRSVYLPVVRSALYDVFQSFDFADPSVMSGRRDTTTVAPQALFMMNSQLVSQGTRAWAQRLLQGPPADDAARVEAIYQQAYSRPATASEAVAGAAVRQSIPRGRDDPAMPAEESRSAPGKASAGPCFQRMSLCILSNVVISLREMRSVRSIRSSAPNHAKLDLLLFLTRTKNPRKRKQRVA